MTIDVQARSDQATATLTIPGMDSDHCAGIVRTSLRRLAGVREIRTSIASHRADVAYDPTRVNAGAGDPRRIRRGGGGRRPSAASGAPRRSGDADRVIRGTGGACVGLRT
jgi:P-type Cu+ transporter